MAEEETSASEDVRPSDRIEIRLRDSVTGEQRRYGSVIQSVTEDGLWVTLPREGNVTVSLAMGTPVQVSTWRDYADHLFGSAVLAAEAGPVPQLLLRAPAPGGMVRRPRRQHFRVTLRLPFKGVYERDGQEQALGGIIQSLGGGGCGLHSPEPIPILAPVLLDFDLPEAGPDGDLTAAVSCSAMAGVVRWARPLDRPRVKPAETHLSGIEFRDIPSRAYTAILRHVAQSQRDALSRLWRSAHASRRGRRGLVPAADPHIVAQLEEGLLQTENQLDGFASTPPATRPPAGFPAKAPAPQPLARPFVYNGKSVLVVDSEEEARLDVSRALTEDGYLVHLAGSGQEALERLVRDSVDLLVTDLAMPGMTGWDLLDAMRLKGIDVPVLLMVGNLTDDGAEVMTYRDIDGYLVKPVLPVEVSKAARLICFPETVDRRPRVLAVDDAADARKLLSTVLAKAGFNVETAVDAAQALAMARDFEPDIVLLDIIMPQMDGLELCRRLRLAPQTRDVPVILLTAHTTPEIVQRAIALRVQGLLVKPVDPGDLVVRVRRALCKSGFC